VNWLWTSLRLSSLDKRSTRHHLTTGSHDNIIYIIMPEIKSTHPTFHDDCQRIELRSSPRRYSKLLLANNRSPCVSQRPAYVVATGETNKKNQFWNTLETSFRNKSIWTKCNWLIYISHTSVCVPLDLFVTTWKDIQKTSSLVCVHIEGHPNNL